MFARVGATDGPQFLRFGTAEKRKLVPKKRVSTIGPCRIAKYEWTSVHSARNANSPMLGASVARIDACSPRSGRRMDPSSSTLRHGGKRESSRRPGEVSTGAAKKRKLVRQERRKPVRAAGSRKARSEKEKARPRKKRKYGRAVPDRGTRTDFGSLGPERELTHVRRLRSWN